MKKITFSHNYQKLKHINPNMPVRLMEVFKSNTGDLVEHFIEYDTIYIKNDRTMRYNLEKNMDCLILIFGQGFDIFTTIRRFTERKASYYENSLGEDFELIIKEDEE